MSKRITTDYVIVTEVDNYYLCLGYKNVGVEVFAELKKCTISSSCLVIILNYDIKI
ncbi:MAG TPA: hypothetical protein PLJ85_04670 [Candidatus Cloacimonas sp.]|nr:hypothetical protein [Candidatus Cloacimonas sp.]